MDLYLFDYKLARECGVKLAPAIWLTKSNMQFCAPGVFSLYCKNLTHLINECGKLTRQRKSGTLQP